MTDLREEAERRHNLHRDHASSRPLSEDYEYVGLVGEDEFGRVFGLDVDMTSRPKGDNGIDFRIKIVLTVDVKTARKPGNLIHEKGKRFVDLYVLAEYNDETGKAELLGWEFGSTLAKAPTKDFGYGIINHYIPRSALRPIASLLVRMVRDGNPTA